MESELITIAIIPLRSGSKSIPLKNIKLLNNKPLAIWTIDAACQSVLINKVIIATDSDMIDIPLKKWMKEHWIESYEKVEFFRRSDESATDTAITEVVMLEVINAFEGDHFVLIQATSPMLTNVDVTLALEAYFDKSFDSMLSGVKQKRFIWNTDASYARPMNYNPMNRPMRQSLEGYFVENGAFYIGTTDGFLNHNCRLFGNIGTYEMDERTYYELDEDSDWEIIGNMMAQQLNKPTHAKDVKLLVLDCDGVLTDGKMYYGPQGEVMKAFNTRDGLGIRLLMEKNIEVAIITGENSDIVKARADKLNIKHVYLGSKDKLSDLKHLMAKLHISYEEIAYIGDDLNDLSVIEKVGLTFSPSDAADIIRKKVDLVLESSGGDGAVREVCDYILEKVI